MLLILFQNAKGKWDGNVITTFEANQDKTSRIKNNSTLMKGNILYFEKSYWRLVEFNVNKGLVFVKHFTSGSIKNIGKDPKGLISRKSISTLGKAKPKKVYISPAGKYKLVDFKIEKVLEKKAVKQKIVP